ncbi:MAG: cytochrome c peroxidase, partial [Pseudohongiella sp.]|nr:cytochrome c peroxidase [Pseudohongiella sp.]
DGRAVTQADQALGPLVNQLEMANTLEAVLATLQSDESYVEDFRNLYPDGVTINNMVDALAYFQRISFTVSDSPFQRYLNGDQSQLSEQALRGWQRFDDIGCVSCHNGINLGGNSYQRIGLLRSYYPDRLSPTLADFGVANRSGRDQDMFAFKVPGMHNVTMTAPYFHDGSVATLHTAIVEMAIFQHGKGLDQQDIEDIAEFLRSMTGRPTGLQLASQIEQRASVTEPGQSVSGIAVSNSYAEAYRRVSTNMAPIHDQLVTEMQRVQDGTVQHFDFVQFQHLELIRHARALQFPPSSLTEPHRSTLQERAVELLAKVESLEWIIADFLYARAMVGVLNARLRDLNESTLDTNELMLLIEQHAAEAAQHLSTLSGILVGALELEF